MIILFHDYCRLLLDGERTEGTLDPAGRQRLHDGVRLPQVTRLSRSAMAHALSFTPQFQQASNNLE